MRKNSMKVSIITVCYNAVDTIEKTIKSVVNQTYKNIEYIIVDGASTDGTMSIVERYRENIEVIISEKDNGIYDAMNKGIRNATGEYIGLLNADDWYEDDAIEKVVNIAQKGEEDVGIITGQINQIREDYVQGKTSYFDIERIWQVMPVAHPATFVKRSVYEKLGTFDTSFRIAADYDFIFRCYLGGVRFLFSDVVLANFRMAGVSCTNIEKTYVEDIRILNKYREFGPNQVIIDEAIAQRKGLLEFYSSDTERLSKALGDYNFLYIWGCGYWGNEIGKVFSSNEIPFVGFIDNDATRWNTYIGEKMIYPPSVLENEDCFVLIAIDGTIDDLRKQIVGINAGTRMIGLKEFVSRVYKQVKV